MPSELHVSRVEPAARSGAEGITYTLSVGQVPLGLLHTGYEGLAFTWSGRVNFERLTEEANRVFAAMGADIDDTYPVEASFIMRENELISLNVIEDKEGKAKDQLGALLGEPNEIVYARFDVTAERYWYMDDEIETFA